MNKPRFTEGEWSIGYYAAGNYPAIDNECSVMTINCAGDIALISNCNPRHDDEERRANALLIAAAPKLYDALIEMVKESDKQGDAYCKAMSALFSASGIEEELTKEVSK